MRLLERDIYLQQLHDALHRVADGGGEMVFLSGEGGIGKTSLIEQFLSDVPGSVGSAVVSCDGLGVPGPFGALFDIADALGPEVVALLAEQAPRDRIFRSVLGAFRAAPGTMVMVGEDAHWTDEATLELIRFLGRRIRSTRALFIVSYRDDQLGPYHPLRRVLGDLANAPGVHRMELPPLSPGVVRAMVAGTGIDADEVYALTEGNPFLLTEIIESKTTGVPATVMDAILSRTSRLSPEGRAVLDACAVIGVTVDPSILAPVIGGPIADTVEECLAVGILRPHGSMLEFRHGISRYAILDSMSLPRRRALHRRVLDVMARLPVDERELGHLAYHAEEAGDAAAARDYGTRAARWAAAFGSHREAASQFGRAVRVSGGLPPDELAPLMEAWSYECYLTGDLREAIRIREDVVRLYRRAGDRLKEGDSMRWLARFSWFSGDVHAARRYAADAYALLSVLPPGPELAMTLSTLSQLAMLAQDAPVAIEWGERAIAMATDLQADDIRAHALINVGTARYERGEEVGRSMLEEAFLLAREIGADDDAVRSLTNLGWTAWTHHDLATAETNLETGIAFASERDLTAMELYQRAIRASVLLARGRLHDARSEAEGLATLPAAISATRVVALTTVGRAITIMGDDATAVLDELHRLASGMGELQRVGPALAAMAEAAWLGGDLAGLLPDLRRVFGEAMARGDRWTAGELGLWLHRACERPDVDGLPEVFALEISGQGAAAGDRWDAMGYPLEAIRARASTGLVDDLRAALEAFDTLGAVADAARIARVLRAMGERHVPRGPRKATRGNVANLTERELEVLALLDEGATNREIAERLFLSVKTAGHHVSAILGKLEVSTRREAVARAAQIGIGRDSGSAK